LLFLSFASQATCWKKYENIAKHKHCKCFTQNIK